MITVPMYQVQLETPDLTVSYEIATADFDAVDVAREHLRKWLPKPTPPIHKGGYDRIGHHESDGELPVVLSWTVRRL